jgi:DNA-binding MarR family transcriptional regulator
MSGRLLEELKQTKPFHSLPHEAYLNLQKTADVLRQRLIAELKPFGVSETQYNVLRILRGAGEEGLRCGDIGDRMVTHDPDITRLLDRLERRELVVRQRAVKDRRVVTARITPAGLALLSQLDAPMDQMMVRLLGHLGSERLTSLIELLEASR